MTESVRVALAIDTSAIDEARTAFEALAAAVEAANAALTRLADHDHGGIAIRMLGDRVICDVKPAKADAA